MDNPCWFRLQRCHVTVFALARCRWHLSKANFPFINSVAMFCVRGHPPQQRRACYGVIKGAFEHDVFGYTGRETRRGSHSRGKNPILWCLHTLCCQNESVPPHTSVMKQDWNAIFVTSMLFPCSWQLPPKWGQVAIYGEQRLQVMFQATVSAAMTPHRGWWWTGTLTFAQTWAQACW